MSRPHGGARLRLCRSRVPGKPRAPGCSAGRSAPWLSVCGGLSQGLYAQGGRRLSPAVLLMNSLCKI